MLGESSSLEEMLLRKEYMKGNSKLLSKATLHRQSKLNEATLAEGRRLYDSHILNTEISISDLGVVYFLQHLPLSARIPLKLMKNTTKMIFLV